MQIKKLTPNLVVRDVEASLKFYHEILGLEKTISVPEQSPYVFATERQHWILHLLYYRCDLSET